MRALWKRPKRALWRASREIKLETRLRRALEYIRNRSRNFFKSPHGRIGQCQYIGVFIARVLRRTGPKAEVVRANYAISRVTRKAPGYSAPETIQFTS